MIRKNRGSAKCCEIEKEDKPLPQIPVVKRSARRKTFEIVDIDDVSTILYCFIEDGILRYQTQDAVYDQLTTIEEAEMYLARFGFDRVERAYIAQLSNATGYDPELELVYFGGKTDMPAKAVPVSKPRRALLIDRLRKLPLRSKNRPLFVLA